MHRIDQKYLEHQVLKRTMSFKTPITYTIEDLNAPTLEKLISISDSGAGMPGGQVSPQYLADQLTLFQPGEDRLCPPLTLAPPKFFTFRHHCVLIALNFFLGRLHFYAGYRLEAK